MSDELFNRQAEQFLLAGLLRYPDDYWSINDVGLVPDDIGSREAKHVFDAIQRVAEDKRTPDLASITEQLRASGHGSSESYMSRLLSVECPLAQARDSARIVKGLTVSRQLQKVGVRAIEVAKESRSDYESALAEVEGEFADLRRILPRSASSAVPADIIADLKKNAGGNGMEIRFSPSLQYLTGGLIPGWLWVIGGFSSVGKSAVACNFILDSLHNKNKWVGVVSTEMPKESYIIRLLSNLSGVDQRSIRDRVTLGSDKISALDTAEKELAYSNLRVFDTVYTLKGIRSVATRMSKTDGLDVLVVDFLQNIHVTGDEVSDARSAIIGLQELAKELSITIICFSQISNDQAIRMQDSGSTDYYSFKGSGAIKDAADVAIMLRRKQQEESPVLYMDVMKNRHEKIGKIITQIDFQTGRIKELNSER